MKWLLAVAAGLVLVACGGDSGADPTTAVTQATVTETKAATATPTSEATATSTSTQVPPTPTPIDPASLSLERFPVPAGSRPHDVAPAPDGGVWFTAQGSGHLGWLDPASGETRLTPLGPGSAPHGVIVGPDDAAWITDGGQNAIVRVAGPNDEVTVWHLPANRSGANLNTATFDRNGVLWFTGQSGIYGSFDPASEEMVVYDAPRGRGPYGIATDPAGDVWMASLAGSYLGRIDIATGEIEVIDPPTAGAGVRRVWADSTGDIWISEWNAGQVARYEPDTGTWTEWPLPGDGAQAYSVYVDDTNAVWLTDFTADTIVRFDPATETFTSYDLPGNPGNVRQMLGRPGEAWGAESATDHLVVVR